MGAKYKGIARIIRWKRTKITIVENCTYIVKEIRNCYSRTTGDGEEEDDEGVCMRVLLFNRSVQCSCASST